MKKKAGRPKGSKNKNEVKVETCCSSAEETSVVRLALNQIEITNNVSKLNGAVQAMSARLEALIARIEDSEKEEFEKESPEDDSVEPLAELG